MSYVLLTADENYGGPARRGRRRHGDERGLLRENNRWAEQVDRSDGEEHGGDWDRVMITFPSSFRSQAELLARTLDGYRVACTRAGRDGVVGVLVGHGSGGVTSSGAQTTPFVDFAPRRLLRVTEQFLQEYGQAMRYGENVTDEFVALREIERAIRESELGRVDFLTCSVGALGGTRLLRALKHRLHTRVRGLTGYLESTIGDDGRVEMRVLQDPHESERAPPPCLRGAPPG